MPHYAYELVARVAMGRRNVNRRVTGLVLALALAAHSPSLGQSTGAEPRTSSTQHRVVGALVGSVTGFVLGSLIGYQATRDRYEYEEGLIHPGLWKGGMLGSAVTAPVAAYVFDGGRGTLWTGLAVSAALTAWVITEDPAPVFVVSLPLTHVLSAILLGRSHD